MRVYERLLRYVKVNTESDPDRVKPAKGRNGTMDGGKMTVKLPALSWNVIRLG